MYMQALVCSFFARVCGRRGRFDYNAYSQLDDLERPMRLSDANKTT